MLEAVLFGLRVFVLVFAAIKFVAWLGDISWT